ncbi:protein COBRA [Sesamum angolense]|uniref:COBRA-like protein n=1 Tax=Sesamum angolense TaxID=2727404 RepID=A0AAE1XE72_9LAMI|nr:protein COBRA [Sesamum angolense]
MELCSRSLMRFTTPTILLLFLLSCSTFTSTEAYDALDPNGNITIKWDVISWTPDGYVAVVTIFNFQQYRHIQAPGWTLGWTWAKKRGDMEHDGRVPKNFTLKAPGPGYTCGPAKIVKPTKYVTSDGRRVTQAMMTWNVTCTYSQFLAQKTPTCCVSLSSFYNDTIVPCPTCTCGCQNNLTQPGSCVNPDSPYLASVVSEQEKRNSYAPLVQCTSHMCPIRVHWHVKVNYKDYWRVKVTITNFNYRMNYTKWNLVVQHPNFDNLTQLFSFNYKPLNPYQNINDTAMLWGVQFYNDLLMQAGPLGNVQSELLFQKDKSTFTFEKGWGFPRRIYFNGDNCVMPPPDAYPYLPNAGLRQNVSLLVLLITLLTSVAIQFVHKLERNMKQFLLIVIVGEFTAILLL